jgi:bis(5'-nucleosyl)-tetraphosphatase (symmetrical)
MRLSAVADYAIGDIQGCYEPLQRLLDHIHFNERLDRLWFVGDLVNRGPQSLAVLRFIKSLPNKAIVTLGNHDLHLLASLFGERPWTGDDDTIQEILHAEDAEDLGHWLRKQAIIHHSPELNFVMCHAGIAPIWDLTQALALGEELEETLSGEHYVEFLKQMYGNTPYRWSESLQGIDRLRLIANYYTRMRFCDREGGLELNYKGTIANTPDNLYPWYDACDRKAISPDILFGHWAALMGVCPHPHIHALDTGCLWGGPLTAMRLQDKQRFSVPGLRV